MFRLLLFSLFCGTSTVCCGFTNNVTCLAEETSCGTRNGLWSCCPIENGICCHDDLYCCANNEKCSSNGICISTNNEISFAFPLRYAENDLNDITCPDGSVCTNDETCCELASGRYACCGYRDAVCCSDHIHCCPHNYVCDLEHRHCRRNFDQVNDIQCPDGQTSCPDGYTCCQLADGGYGCCPLQDAVCCSDHLHCCPHGNVCDIEHGRCVSRISIPWSRKRAAFRSNEKLVKIINRKEEENLSKLKSSSKFQREIICPDGITICNSTSSCCLRNDQMYGCCPLQVAVCCPDRKHCCPRHYKCDDTHIFKCINETLGSIPLLETQMAEKKISSKINRSFKSLSTMSTIISPDENLCPDESTCCQLKNDTYGCCPYESGNCCSDQIHCCANGYACDASGSRCIRHFNDVKESPMKKLLKNPREEDQLCPDGVSRCSMNSSCCPNKNTSPLTYSCCPYSKGVCCGSNGSVCCPNNYDCNEDELSCELRDSYHQRKLFSTSEYYQCGSSNIYCSSDQTCCDTKGTSSQSYACCPYENGQCCSDGEHCCALGYTCDLEGGGCV